MHYDENEKERLGLNSSPSLKECNAQKTNQVIHQGIQTKLREWIKEIIWLKGH